jgi:uncharacterized protein (DUF1499 family)
MWRTALAATTSAWVVGCGLGTPALITRDGALAPCDAPNCVSSQQPGTANFIEPIRYSGSRDAAHLALLKIVGTMEGAGIVSASPDYVHVEFTSKVMQYVDDLELVFPATQKLVQVRSASRIGYYDFHTNRKRVEELRERFDALQP